MNDPRYDGLEQRVKKLEQDQGDMVENEKMLLKLAKYHRAALQGLDAKIDLEMGDVRERFDTIEQRLDRQDKRFDSIEQTQAGHTEVLNKIVNLLEGQQKAGKEE